MEVAPFESMLLEGASILIVTFCNNSISSLSPHPTTHHLTSNRLVKETVYGVRVEALRLSEEGLVCDEIYFVKAIFMEIAKFMPS